MDPVQNAQVRNAPEMDPALRAAPDGVREAGLRTAASVQPVLRNPRRDRKFQSRWNCSPSRLAFRALSGRSSLEAGHIRFLARPDCFWRNRNATGFESHPLRIRRRSFKWVKAPWDLTARNSAGTHLSDCARSTTPKTSLRVNRSREPSRAWRDAGRPGRYWVPPVFTAINRLSGNSTKSD